MTAQRSQHGANLAAGAALGLCLGACSPQPPPPPLDPLRFLSGAPAGFERALAPIEFEFPRDHGPHSSFRTEWWYLTGHLADPRDPQRRFALQWTLFRQGLVPPGAAEAPRASQLASGDAYVCHVALGDVLAGRQTAFERSARGAPGIAGASAAPVLAFLGPNSLKGVAGLGTGERPRFELSIQEPGLSVELQLVSAKDLVAHGEAGLSRKGAAPGNASYYFSATRLEARGWLDFEGQRLAVEGRFWMDREWSTSVLEAGQVGWDWVSLQLDDGSELMAFVLEREDGALDPASSGTFIDPDGRSRPLRAADFSFRSLSNWVSPRSGRRFTTGLEIRVPALELELEARALFPDQELDLPLSYYEGAFDARGYRAGRALTGRGFVEQVRGARRGGE
jgi:predicted secreted hydrolase